MWKWIAGCVLMVLVALASFAVALLLQAEPSPVSDTLILTGWQLLAVLMGVMFGASVSTVAALVALVRVVRADTEKMTAFELFYTSQSENRKKAIRQGVELLKESAALLDEVTDDVPVREKEG